jgi:ABC-type multidrug transport system fused ATPase/permease subunit
VTSQLILVQEATIIEADMVIMMDAGRVFAVGKPSELIQRVNSPLQ